MLRLGARLIRDRQVVVEAREVHRLRGDGDFAERLSLRDRRLLQVTHVVIAARVVLRVAHAHHAVVEQLGMRVRPRRLDRAQAE